MAICSFRRVKRDEEAEAIAHVVRRLRTQYLSLDCIAQFCGLAGAPTR